MNYLFLITEAVVPTLIGSLYFYFGGKDWEKVFMLTLVIAPIGLIGSIWLPNSPQYLLDCKETKAAEAQIEAIASINRCKTPKLYSLIKENDMGNSVIGNNKLAYFKTWDNFSQLLAMVIILSYCGFNGVLLSYYIKYIKANIFFLKISGVMCMAVVELASYYLLKYFDVKAVATTIILFSIPLSTMLVLSVSGESEMLGWLSVIGISSSMDSLGILMYYFVSDSFPTSVVPLVLTISNFSANISQIIAPIIAEMQGLVPVIAFSCTSCLALLTLLLLNNNKKMRAGK